MDSNTLTIISIVLLSISLILSATSIIIFRKIKQIKTLVSENGHPENLEEILLAITSNLKTLEKRVKISENHNNSVDNKFQGVFQKIGVIRYDAYGDEGGKLSFSLTLLNDNNDGICLTSIHGRDQNRTYIKTITNKISEHTLSQEEQESLKQAFNS